MWWMSLSSAMNSGSRFGVSQESGSSSHLSNATLLEIFSRFFEHVSRNLFVVPVFFFGCVFQEFHNVSLCAFVVTSLFCPIQPMSNLLDLVGLSQPIKSIL